MASAEKVMAGDMWNAKQIILIVYHEIGKKIFV